MPISSTSTARPWLAGGPVVYPTAANAFDSRLQGDQVPFGSSPTKSQKKKKKSTAVT